MADFKDWSEGWIKEGHFISFLDPSGKVRYYEQVIARDIAHYEYDFDSVDSGSTAGPIVPDYLIPTIGYTSSNNQNQLWQVIFGIRGEIYLYVQLPSDIDRHGLPKLPKPGTVTRRVAHFEEWMSPYQEPSFITEHFLMKPDYDRVSFTVYNPEDITITPSLNFFVNKMVTERIGIESEGVLTPAHDKYEEVLEKLYKRVIPHRPISLMPVRAPASER